MENDERAGRWTFWYPDGALREIRDYEAGQGRILSSWYPDGREMVVQGDGAYVYYRRGRVAEKGRYEKGLAVGRWEFFDELGRLTEVRWYREGGRANENGPMGSSRSGSSPAGKEGALSFAEPVGASAVGSLPSKGRTGACEGEKEGEDGSPRTAERRDLDR